MNGQSSEPHEHYAAAYILGRQDWRGVP